MSDEQALADLHNAAVAIDVLRDELPPDRDGTVEAALRRAVEHVNQARKLIQYATAKAGRR